MKTKETSKAIDDFCAAINESLGMGLGARIETLRDLALPEGFHSVVVRHPGNGAFVGCWSATVGSSTMLASRLSGWLSRRGRSTVRSAAFHEPADGILNLVLCS